MQGLHVTDLLHGHPDPNDLFAPGHPLEVRRRMTQAAAAACSVDQGPNTGWGAISPSHPNRRQGSSALGPKLRTGSGRPACPVQWESWMLAKSRGFTPASNAWRRAAGAFGCIPTTEIAVSSHSVGAPSGRASAARSATDRSGFVSELWSCVIGHALHVVAGVSWRRAPRGGDWVRPALGLAVAARLRPPRDRGGLADKASWLRAPHALHLRPPHVR